MPKDLIKNKQIVEPSEIVKVTVSNNRRIAAILALIKCFSNDLCTDKQKYFVFSI